MRKNYLINSRQLQRIVESLNKITKRVGVSKSDILSETEYVTYKFYDTPKITDYDAVFFDGANINEPFEGKYNEDDTKKIIFLGQNNMRFEFDKKEVNKSKNNSLYVWLKEFEKKYPSLMKRNDPSPVITDNQIKSAYQSSVFEALKELYKKTNWDSESGRGPSKRGGVINLYQVGDYAKEAGLENFEGGDWSILNYFDTNPKVREEILGEYKRVNNLNKITNLEDFKEWIVNNKELLFKDEETNKFLKKLVEINKKSYISGLKNEIKAFNFVGSFLSDYPNFQLSSLNLPGSPKDRAGIDFSLMKDGKEFRTYQAKPLSNYFVNDDRGRKIYRVYSYNIENLKNINVDYFVFTSDGKDGAIIFKNQKGKYTLGFDEKTSTQGKKYKNEYIDFSYEPFKYDVNF